MEKSFKLAHDSLLCDTQKGDNSDRSIIDKCLNELGQ